MDIRKVENIAPYLADLSKYFRHFYEREPWADYKGCDKCYGSKSLTDAPRFGPDEATCPQCKEPLGPFWSMDRCKSALSCSTLSVCLFDNGKLCGWIIAKKNSEDVLAIEFMGLSQILRRRKPKPILLLEAIYVISLLYTKKRIGVLKKWSENRLQKVPIISLQLYLKFEEEAEKMGFKEIQTKTHESARNIFYALRSVGFHLTKTKLANNRVLFRKKLY